MIRRINAASRIRAAKMLASDSTLTEEPINVGATRTEHTSEPDITDPTVGEEKQKLRKNIQKDRKQIEELQ